MNEIDRLINSYSDWRGDLLRELRQLINETSPELKEDFKWGVPVWENKGLVCAISAFKDHVKMNFFKGAHLDSIKNVFNSGLDSKEHRSINFSKDDKVDVATIKLAIKVATDYNK